MAPEQFGRDIEGPDAGHTGGEAMRLLRDLFAAARALFKRDSIDDDAFYW